MRSDRMVQIVPSSDTHHPAGVHSSADGVRILSNSGICACRIHQRHRIRSMERVIAWHPILLYFTISSAITDGSAMFYIVLVGMVAVTRS